MKIGFVGGGNMAEAILAAVLKNGIAAKSDVTVSDIADGRRSLMAEKYGVAVTADNVEAIRNKDVIVLAVKPQVLDAVITGLNGQLKPDQLIVSIVAGKSIRTISEGLGHSNMVRSMPNTPAQIGQGMTVWTTTPSVTPAQKKMAAQILGAMGTETYADDEKYLDMATAVSGSGPAYVFLFVEAMMAGAEKLGFSPEVSRKLVLQTLAGASSLLEKSGKTPQELRRMVTSPGGTTAAAVATFEAGGFVPLVENAIASAHRRAKELGG